MMMMAWIALLVLLGVVAWGIVSTSKSSSPTPKNDEEEAKLKEHEARP